MIKVYKEVMKSVANKIQKQHGQSLTFDVRSKPPKGLGNVRHIGAWTVRKVTAEQQRHVRANMATSNTRTRNQVFRRHGIASRDPLEQQQAPTGTLKVTEDLQFRTRRRQRFACRLFEWWQACLSWGRSHCSDEICHEKSSTTAAEEVGLFSPGGVKGGGHTCTVIYRYKY